MHSQDVYFLDVRSHFKVSHALSVYQSALHMHSMTFWNRKVTAYRTNTTAHSLNAILISLGAFASVVRVTLRSSQLSAAYIYRKHSITSLHTMQLSKSCACIHQAWGPSAWSHLSKLSFLHRGRSLKAVTRASHLERLWRKRTIFALTGRVNITLGWCLWPASCVEIYVYNFPFIFLVYFIFFPASLFVFQGAFCVFWYPVFLLIPDSFYRFRSRLLNASVFHKWARWLYNDHVYKFKVTCRFMGHYVKKRVEGIFTKMAETLKVFLPGARSVVWAVYWPVKPYYGVPKLVYIGWAVWKQISVERFVRWKCFNGCCKCVCYGIAWNMWFLTSIECVSCTADVVWGFVQLIVLSEGRECWGLRVHIVCGACTVFV